MFEVNFIDKLCNVPSPSVFSGAAANETHNMLQVSEFTKKKKERTPNGWFQRKTSLVEVTIKISLPAKTTQITCNQVMQITNNNVPNVTLIEEPLNSQEIIENKIRADNLDEQPFYICDIADIIKKHQIWKSLLPRVIPFYAVKCNDDLVVLETLASLGVGFDCASKGEIKKIKDIGVSSSRIIFANPTKPKSHLCYAVQNEVKFMTFDSDIELYKIQKIYPDASLILRIRCDDRKAQCPLGDKFGCDPNREAEDLIQLGSALNLKIVGISFHVGSGCKDSPIYRKAIKAAKKLFDFAKNIGVNFHILDIGGGFPGDKNTSIEEIAIIINSALDTYFPSNDITVIAEPGRFYVSSAYTLICRIHSKKEVIRNGRAEKMYFINDGVYGSFNCNLYDHKIVTPILMKTYNADLFKSTIWGPSCDALDQVCEEIMLPDLQIDDTIVFENMGAYTIPIASPFNGFPLPKIEYYLETEYFNEIQEPFQNYDFQFEKYFYEKKNHMTEVEN